MLRKYIANHKDILNTTRLYYICVLMQNWQYIYFFIYKAFSLCVNTYDRYFASENTEYFDISFCVQLIYSKSLIYKYSYLHIWYFVIYRLFIKQPCIDSFIKHYWPYKKPSSEKKLAPNLASFNSNKIRKWCPN